MSLPDDQQNANPEPQTNGTSPRPLRGPIVTVVFDDSGAGSNHSGKKEIVRINLPPQPPAKPAIKGS